MNEKLGYAVRNKLLAATSRPLQVRISMKSLCISTVLVALALTTAPAFAQKSIGKCMRPDCESMQQYCDESRSAELSLNFGDGLAGQAAAVMG